MPLLLLSARLLVPSIRNFPLGLGGEEWPFMCRGRLPLWCLIPPLTKVPGREGPPLLNLLISSSSRRLLFLASFFPFLSFSVSGGKGGATEGMIIWRGRGGRVPPAVPYIDDVDLTDRIVPEYSE